MYRLPVRCPIVQLVAMACSSTAILVAAPPASIRGNVVDSSRAPVAAATLELATAQGAILRRAATDSRGQFEFSDLAPDAYELKIEALGLGTRRLRVLASSAGEPIRIELRVAGIRSEVTVTATRSVENIETAHQTATRLERDEIFARSDITLGSALKSSPGVMVQETTPGQTSPHIRGLTGYQTLLLVDGIRFNTSTFRSGPNQYLAFIDPSQVDAIEIVGGPTASAFGSDAMGGALHVLTRRAPAHVGMGPSVHGDAGLFGAGADLSGRSTAQVSIGTDRVNWLAGAGAQRHNDLRAGGGLDSHSVFHRFFGMQPTEVRGLLGPRLQDTSFSQYAAHTRFSLRPSVRDSLTLWYQRGDSYDVRSYRDLLGGLGRLQARFEPQTVNFFYGRFEKLALGRLDSVSGTFSINSQRDDTVRQASRITDVITRDYNRVDVFGYAGQASTHLSGKSVAVFGGEIYRERIRSARFEDDPRTGLTASRRALYPDRSGYTTTGLFVQSSTELPWRLRAQLGARLTDVRFRPLAAAATVPEAGTALTPRRFGDLTFHSSLAWHANSHVGLHAVASRGFRAPNLNDLGAVGFTGGAGFEIPVEQATGSGAMLSRDSSEGALPSGPRVSRLGPETLMDYEFGVRVSAASVYARTQVFSSSLEDPIVRRTLLFDARSAPSALAGLPVSVIAPTEAQRAAGVVGVATRFDPRAVKAFVNDGRMRYYGVESMLRWAVSSRWSADAHYTFLAGRELDPDRPVRRLPPQQGYLSVRYVPSGRRVWFEAGTAVSGPQRRFNPADIDDERIGASRRRSDIAGFFQSAIVGRYLSPGPDGRPGTADDRFQPSGETLAQIQDRVLPVGSSLYGVTVKDDSSRVPLFDKTSGSISFDFRIGYQMNQRWNLIFGVSNLSDRNYRVHGSGVDAAGRSALVGLRYGF